MSQSIGQSVAVVLAVDVCWVLPWVLQCEVQLEVHDSWRTFEAVLRHLIREHLGLAGISVSGLIVSPSPCPLQRRRPTSSRLAWGARAAPRIRIRQAAGESVCAHCPRLIIIIGGLLTVTARLQTIPSY
ncbi:hypothetical protein OF83DRAFT_791865 [Amylostereum chailletii]|nr:hypothetical protein OF83DRAFT_791865 [Amylostereum chailletii]